MRSWKSGPPGSYTNSPTWQYCTVVQFGLYYDFRISQRTSSMHIGTNLVVLPVHQPIRLAEDALTVDALSGGRLRLGVGLGYLEREFATFGQSMNQRRQRFESNFDVLRA